MNGREIDLLKYLSSKILEEIEVLKNDTALGKAKDFGDYKYACGIVRGFVLANTIIADTAERVKTDE